MTQFLHQIIQTRLTREQADQVTAHATALGLKPATYMRLKLLQPDGLKLSPLIYIQIQSELGELSNGLERISHRLTQAIPSTQSQIMLDLNEELQSIQLHLIALQTQLNQHVG